MESNLKTRLYNIEINPPQQVWENLSVNLDEINADLKISEKIYQTEAISNPDVWNNIKNLLTDAEYNRKKAIVINFRKVALAAAVFFGIAISIWLLFFYSNKQATNFFVNEKKPIEIKSDTPVEKQNTIVTETSDNNLPVPRIQNIGSAKAYKGNQTSLANFRIEAVPSIKYANSSKNILNTSPKSKSFDKPIDDLTMIASDDNYVTMVNANGRMVKLPVHLAYLAPRLQDKPINEDYHEIMFGENTFWKDKLSDWRQKLATSTAYSGDVFSNMIDLLKTIETSTSESEQGR